MTLKVDQNVLVQNEKITKHNYFRQNGLFHETKFIKRIQKIIENIKFSIFICCLVIFNIVILIVGYSFDETSQIAHACEIIQLVLTIVFSIEISCKIILCPKSFFSKPYDIFDFIIISANLVEIIYELCSGDSLLSPNSLSSPAIKSLNFLRIFHFISELDYWKTGSFLLKEMIRTLVNTLDFILVILIFILLASLYGMQLFAYTVRLEGDNISNDLLHGETPRLNYDTFLESVMTTTLIFLNEEWHVVMFQYMRAFGGKGAIYFILVVLGGSVLLMKMFIALFINNFLNSDTIKKFIDKKPIFHQIKEKIEKTISRVSSFQKFQKV